MAKNYGHLDVQERALIEPCESVAEAARSLGAIKQMLSNGIKDYKPGKLEANGRGSKLAAE